MLYDDEHVLVGRITRPKKGYTIVRCDRTSPLGNPFPMKGKGVDERNRVCDSFKDYFNKEIKLTGSVVHKSMVKIYRLAQEEKVLLTCWCYPERCHCDTIREFLLEQLNKN